MANLLAKISSLHSELIHQILKIFKRRSLITFATLFAIGLSFSLLITACNSTDSSTSSTSSNTIPSEQAQTLRIGYQKGATVLNLLKTQGALEKRLKPQGTSVEWLDFVAGPQMLEALNVGSIDFGLVGETPPIFAQAAGAPLVYVAYEPPSPAAEAILVQQNSPIRSVADLKGKTVALNKGSNVHYLLVRALESAGLKYSDIKPAFLPPGDARAAYRAEDKTAAQNQHHFSGTFLSKSLVFQQRPKFSSTEKRVKCITQYVWSQSFACCWNLEMNQGFLQHTRLHTQPNLIAIVLGIPDNYSPKR